MEDSYEDLFDLESPPVSEILTTLGLKASSMAERVVLIAGGARGIAAQAARGFGHLGARVVIVDKRTDGQQLAEEIRAEGADAYFRLMDLTVDHEIELLTAWLEEQFGQVDVLIHNAVDFEVSAVTELSLAGWDYANNTNVRSAFILISKLLPGMVERSRGTIVTMIAPGGLAFASAMSASKHALRSLTQSLAAELGKDSGVSVMGFAPGLVATEMVREVFPEYCARLQMDFRDYVHGFSHNPGYEGLMPQEHCGASLVHAVVHDEQHHGLIASAVRPLQAAGLIRGPVKFSRDDNLPDNSGRLLEHISEIHHFNATVEEHIQRRVERLENQLAKEQHSAQHSQKVAAVGILAAGVAHEINNPLTYVLGNLEFMGECLEQNASSLGSESAVAEMRQLLEETSEGIGRIRAIVRELRQFSRIDENAARTQVDVHDLLGSAVRIVANQIVHRARLVRDFQPTPLVLGNEGKLCQVIVNLLVNASQAISTGDAENDEIRICTRTDQLGRAVIEIHDTGCGISDEDLGRIFDPFFTTKSCEQGTGLGLSVCQGIIIAMGGEIQVASEVGQGSTFRVLLPGAPERQKVVPLRRRQVKTRRPLKILLIDDEVGVARTLERFLPGEEVEICYGGRTGLASLVSSWKYDIVFCDLMMPDLSGMDIYEAVLSLNPEFVHKFIFMTGGAFSHPARSFLQGGAFSCVFKPFSSKDIQTAIEAVLKKTAPQILAL